MENQTQNKPLLIIGSAKSGKTRLALNLMSAFKSPKMLSGRRTKDLRSPFFFSSLNESTDMVVIDDVRGDVALNIFEDINGQIKVEPQSKPSFCINPQVIVICDSDYSDKSMLEAATYTRRYNVLDMDSVSDFDLCCNIVLNQIKTL